MNINKFNYLVDLVEDTRHAFMACRQDITKGEARLVTEGGKALINATRRKAARENDDSIQELQAAQFLQDQFEAAVAIFSFQENFG